MENNDGKRHEEIRAIVDEVYKKCADMEMTLDEFGLVVSLLKLRNESVTSDLRYQLFKTKLPKSSV